VYAWRYNTVLLVAYTPIAKRYS